MENIVNLTGKVVSLREVDGDKVDIVVEVTRRYGVDKTAVDKHNVTVLAGGQLKEAWKKANASNRPLFVSVRGVIASRKFNENEKYANHSYIVGMSVGVMGTLADTQWADVVIEGEVVASQQKFTAKGTEFISLLIRNTRTVRGNDFSASVNVTIYGDKASDVGIFSKGTKVFVVGRADSYESSSNPGKYVTGIVASDIALSGVAAQKTVEAPAPVDAEDDIDDALDLADLAF